jgi:hypothetical protein
MWEKVTCHANREWVSIGACLDLPGQSPQTWRVNERGWVLCLAWLAPSIALDAASQRKGRSPFLPPWGRKGDLPLGKSRKDKSPSPSIEWRGNSCFAAKNSLEPLGLPLPSPHPPDWGQSICWNFGTWIFPIKSVFKKRLLEWFRFYVYNTLL